jgi:hypothetical protein
MLLQYHPDQFRLEYHEDGITKDDAELHFKMLCEARDTMLNYVEATPRAQRTLVKIAFE